MIKVDIQFNSRGLENSTVERRLVVGSVVRQAETRNRVAGRRRKAHIGQRRSDSEDVDNRRSISACGVVSLGYRRCASLYRPRSTINRRLSFSSA